MEQTGPTIHASAVLFGHRGILIRGASRAGKSALALSLLQAADGRFARLVGDDRLHLQAVHGRLLMYPAAPLRGLLEIRGVGIVRVPFEPVAAADLVVDLDAADAARLPAPDARSVEILGIRLARLPVAPGAAAASSLLAFLRWGALADRELQGGSAAASRSDSQNHGGFPS